MPVGRSASRSTTAGESQRGAQMRVYFDVSCSARLVLLVEEEDDSGEIVFQRRYACNRNDTMADAGAEPHAKFVVELVDENEEDDV